MLCEVCGKRPAHRTAVHVSAEGVAERSVCDVCSGQSIEPIESAHTRSCDLHFRLFLTDLEMAEGVLKRIRVLRHKPCPGCEDWDEVERIGCPLCGGTSMVPQAVRLTVRVPPGVRSGIALRLEGKGDYDSAEGRRGDILLHVASVTSRGVMSSSE